MEMINNIYRYY